MARWEERSEAIVARTPLVGATVAQYASRALPVLDYVAMMTAPLADIRKRERRVVQKLWHAPGITLPGCAHVDLARWHCPRLASAQARMCVVVVRAAIRTSAGRPT